VPAVPWFRQTAAGFVPQRSVISPRSIHVRYVVETGALRQVFLRISRLSLSKSFHHCPTLTLSPITDVTILITDSVVKQRLKINYGRVASIRSHFGGSDFKYL